MHNHLMSEKAPSSFNPADLLSTSFVLGSTALEMALMTTISVARGAQAIAQSTDMALAKYIEMTEQEINRMRRRESVKVE
jgi:hypothetical protein